MKPFLQNPGTEHQLREEQRGAQKLRAASAVSLAAPSKPSASNARPPAAFRGLARTKNFLVRGRGGGLGGRGEGGHGLSSPTALRTGRHRRRRLRSRRARGRHLHSRKQRRRAHLKPAQLAALARMPTAEARRQESSAGTGASAEGGASGGGGGSGGCGGGGFRGQRRGQVWQLLPPSPPRPWLPPHPPPLPPVPVSLPPVPVSLPPHKRRAPGPTSPPPAA
jgi:hypothetical protein